VINCFAGLINKLQDGSVCREKGAADPGAVKDYVRVRQKTCFSSFVLPKKSRKRTI